MTFLKLITTDFCVGTFKYSSRKLIYRHLESFILSPTLKGHEDEVSKMLVNVGLQFSLSHRLLKMRRTPGVSFKCAI